ncbi:LLM class flavin-dependent oxidoreductase [Solwaraspora sp. WMMD1047]|uniref:LLM class flavin-dependent oxidoreductase n=1 Tax=Solwaraspora sp. WMMD1047 TaxID=3016102 RepID=UPI0024160DC3|nr:LLM class flavin-dependent oxidoreductase [Solwaraspora sp. WMMD1047]MDG4830631.1 LLM class flavin-dependent oxidoreductase [Solwaraspora sp. WMMD1047]
MKYGISLLPDCSPDTRPAVTYFEDVLRLAELGEQLGLHYVKMTEHYLHRAGGYCPSPLTYLAAVAARTKRIRLLTGGIQASFHHPIQIAAHAAQVDAMSHGRLEVGFVRAFLPHDFEAFEVDMTGSRARFQATVDAVVRLWTEDKVSERTPYFTYADATNFPPTVQRPHPPVWICVAMSEASFRYAGERGHNLMITATPQPEAFDQVRKMIEMYRDVFQEHHGASGRVPQVAAGVPLMVAPTDAEADAAARRHQRGYFEVWGEASQTLKSVDAPDYAGYAKMIERYLTMDEDRMIAGTMHGSPATVARKTRELEDALPLDVILWQLDFGGQDYATMSRSLRMFVEESLPLMR